MSSNLQGNPLPSPQANMFQKSMTALASTFEPIQEDDQVMNYASAQPRMDYILENYHNNLKRVQIPVWKDNLNYSDNMLMLENLIQVPTPATTPLANRILDGLTEVLLEKKGEQGLNAQSNGGHDDHQRQQSQGEDQMRRDNLLQHQEQQMVVQNMMPSQEQQMMMMQNNDQSLENHVSMIPQQADQMDHMFAPQQFPRQVLRRFSSESAVPISAAEVYSDVGSHSYSPPPSLPGSHYPGLDYHQHPGFFYSQNINMPFQNNSQFNDFDGSSHSLKNNPSSLENVRRKSFLQQHQIFAENPFQQNQQFLSQSPFPANVYASPQHSHSYAESPKRSSLPLSHSSVDFQHIPNMGPAYGTEIHDPNPPTPASGSDSKKPKKKRAFQCHFQNCKKSFETESRMEKHYASHLPGGDKVKPFKCDSCPVSFSRSHGTIPF